MDEECVFFVTHEAESGFGGETSFDDVLRGLEAIVFGFAKFDAAGFRVPENPAGAALVFGAGLAYGTDRDGAGLVGGDGESGFAFPDELRFWMVENSLLMGVAKEANLVLLRGEQFEGGSSAAIAVDVVECLRIMEAAVGNDGTFDEFGVGKCSKPFGLPRVEGNGGMDEAG